MSNIEILGGNGSETKIITIWGGNNFSHTMTQGETQAIYDQDAAAIFKALAETLPGGTWDRLAAKIVRDTLENKKLDITVS